MKIGANPNFPVWVKQERWEQEEDEAEHFGHIVRVTLNHTVPVLFVPDVSTAAPPWDFGTYPADGARIGGELQARVFTVLVQKYSVTPNEALAGTYERITPPPGSGLGEESSVVFYVGAEEYTRCVADLDQMERQQPERAGLPTVSQLRNFEVIGFLEQRVVASGELTWWDAELLGVGSQAGRP